MARFKGYRPDPDGMRELARSPEMSALCVEEAQRGASWANTIDPDGKYVAAPATVPAGWSNESRAGAEVTQTAYSHVGPRERVLVRAVNMIEVG